MRKFITNLSLLFLFGLITPQIFATQVAALDKIVVIVNDNVITQSDINKALSAAQQQLASTNTPMPSEKELRKQVIDNLINRNIELQMVDRAGIKISNSELNSAIEDIAKRNNVTIEQLKTTIEATGISYADYRKQIQDQMAIVRLQQGIIGSNVNVTDQEIDTFIHNNKNVRQPNAEYNLEDILIPISDTPSPADIQKAQQQAQNIVQKIKKGANFKTIAAAESKGNEAMEGGDLGWSRIGEMPTIFGDAVKNMNPGSIAGPLRAPNGFHIIKLVAVRNNAVDLTRDQVRMLIFKHKYEEKLESWLQQLRAGAYVQFVNQ
jgi:peptidyl-prolyl cis-trans isomerase SurA